MMEIQATAQPAPSAAEIRQQVQNSIRDAQQAATDAQQMARDAAHARRDAQINGRPFNFVTTQPPGFDPNGGMPPQVENISIAFFLCTALIVIGWPLARAFGRRIERRGEVAAIASPQLTEQLQRIEQAVDAMAIEIERISESQRFMAKLQSGNAERALREAP